MRDLRTLPQVDALSREERLSSYPERVRLEAARAAIAKARTMMLDGREADVVGYAIAEADRLASYSTRRVLNASGIILHTGLGRARLALSVVEHLAEIAAGHSVVEFDLDSGQRGDRQSHVRSLFRALTGAEDALVVNNAAAGVVLTLTAFAQGRGVLLSRGEMVEIGGSFRMPQIIEQSGCHLLEVGCTNKTRISDYRDAITESSGAILRCHTSNYRIIGFTERPSLNELVQLGAERNLPVIDDQGTGCLVDTTRFGIERQPTILDSVRAGADVVIASCDKMLGGPQAGMILGSKEVVGKIKSHPLARAMRVDKLTLAALEATLRLYLYGRELEIPTLAALAKPISEVRAACEDLAEVCSGAVVEEGVTEIGGGSAPGSGIVTMRLGLSCENADNLSRELRQGSPPIVSRIENGKVWLDPRTLDDEDVATVKHRLKELNC